MQCVDIVLLVLIFFLLKCSQSKRCDNDLLEQNEFAIKQRAKEVRQFMLPMPEDMFSDLLVQTAERYIPVQALSQECRNHSYHLLDGFLRGDFWALKMLDAGSKLVSGVFDGHIQDLGNYEQCINIQEPHQMFSGQLCVVETTGILPQEISNRNPGAIDIGVMFSVCVPSSCSDDDINAHMDLILAPINASTVSPKNPNLPSGFSRIICSSAEGIHYRVKDFIAMTVFGGIVLLVTIGTLCGSKAELLTSFSLRRNFQGLMDTRTPPGEITCLNGLRVIFMIMVMTYHRIWIPFMLPSYRYNTILQLLGTVTTGVIELFPKSTDGFFLIGGVVMSYSFFRSIQKQAQFNPFHFYLNRYFRVTPVLAVLMIYSATLFIHSAQGPVWVRNLGGREDACIKNWWAGLLHISNYVFPRYTCVPESWYIACDFQLHLISPLFLIPLYKRPRVGMTLLTACFLVSVVATSINAYIKELRSGYYTATVFSTRSTDMNEAGDHGLTHFRAPPFFMGIALGYLLHYIKQDETRLKLPKGGFLFGWFVSVLLLAGLVAVTIVIVDPYHEFSPWLDPLYMGLSRPLFSACFSWLIFACDLGYGGLLNQFLSWHGFRPLARLVFAVYLVHMFMQLIQSGRIQVPLAFSFVEQVYFLMGDLVMSFSLAVVLHLVVEVPFCKVVSFYLKRKKDSKTVSMELEENTRK